jgi:hypothetical protein
LAKSNALPLALSGKVYSKPDDVDNENPAVRLVLEPAESSTSEADVVTIGDERFVMLQIPFEPGDVAVYSRLDGYGRAAVRGGHSNYGYSGYFRATVFDGARWRNFRIWDFVPEADRCYRTQADIEETKERLFGRIREKAGATLEWGARTYVVAHSVA